MEFLSNPAWQLLMNLGIGFLTIIVSVLIFRKQQSRRGLNYEIISDTPILSIKAEVKDKVQILFDNKPVNHVRLIILRIWNSGNIPILPNEYIDPISIAFGEGAEIIDTDVLETSPGDIKEKARTSLKVDSGNVLLEPILLNSTDSLTIKILLTQQKVTKELKIVSRIAGVNQIQYFVRVDSPSRPARIFASFSFILFLMLITYFLFSRYEHDLITDLFLMLIIIASALTYIAVFIMLLSIAYSLIYDTPFSKQVNITVRRLIFLIQQFFNDQIQ